MLRKRTVAGSTHAATRAATFARTARHPGAARRVGEPGTWTTGDSVRRLTLLTRTHTSLADDARTVWA